MAALRSLAALLALAFGWVVIVSGTVAALWFLSLPALVYVVNDPRQFTASILHGTILFGLLAALGHYLIFLLTPVSRQSRLLCAPLKPVRLQANHPLVVCTHQLAEAMRVRTPEVWVVESRAVNAFALSGWRRDAVLLTTSLLNTFPADEVLWVLAHELGHLRHGDPRSGVFWIAAMRTLRLAYAVRGTLLRAVINIVRAIPVLGLLEVLITLPLALLLYALTWVERFARGAFKLVDRILGRRMEYRADREATDLLGAEIGARALSRLGGDIEPAWGGIFATHPPLAKRIRRIHQDTATR